MTIPEIYVKANAWIDNNSKLMQLEADSTPQELEQNQEYQGEAFGSRDKTTSD